MRIRSGVANGKKGRSNFLRFASAAGKEERARCAMRPDHARCKAETEQSEYLQAGRKRLIGRLHCWAVPLPPVHQASHHPGHQASTLPDRQGVGGRSLPQILRALPKYKPHPSCYALWMLPVLCFSACYTGKMGTWFPHCCAVLTVFEPKIIVC